MKTTLWMLCAWIAATVVAGLAPTPAASAQPVGNTWNLCAEQTSKRERLDGIPRHLLAAISVAEAGRWDRAGQANVAWPWTVTARGEGRFFATKRDAVTHVLELWSQGVTNIDVGCMQVNQHYHGGAFADIEQALDPAANVAYASRYLGRLHAATRSWIRAAGYYHSTNPDLYPAYMRKVLRLWNEERQSGGGSTTALRLTAPIDTARTAKLNARLKAARAAERTAERTAERGADRASSPDAAREGIRRAQLAAWRGQLNSPDGGVHLAAVLWVEAEARRRQALLAPSDDDDGDERFAAKRKAQLEAWRSTLAAAPGSS